MKLYLTVALLAAAAIYFFWWRKNKNVEQIITAPRKLASATPVYKQPGYKEVKIDPAVVRSKLPFIVGVVPQTETQEVTEVTTTTLRPRTFTIGAPYIN